VADLDATTDLECRTTLRAGVVVAYLGHVDHAVSLEVASVHEVHHVLAGLVGAGDPLAADRNAWVEQVTDAR